MQQKISNANLSLQVIESKTTDMTELDPNVSVEDLVSALNKSGTEGPAEEDNKPTSPVSHKHSRFKFDF